MEFGQELIQPNQDSSVEIIEMGLGFQNEDSARSAVNSAPNPELRAPNKRKSKQQKLEDASKWTIDLPPLEIEGKVFHLEVNLKKQAQEAIALIPKKKMQCAWTAQKK